MKSLLVFSFLFLFGTGAAFSEDPVRHVLVMGDESRGFVHYLDQFNTNNNFSVKADRPVWDMKRIADNRYRYVHGNSFTVIDLKERKGVETFSDTKLIGLTSVCDLPDGGFLAATNQKVGEPAKEAVVVYKYSVDRKLHSRSVFAGLSKVRMMTVLPSGEILLAHNDGVARCTLASEGSEQGKIVQSYKLPRAKNAYKAILRKDGGLWVGGGYACALYAYADEGHVVKTFEAQQPEGLKNHFYGGIAVQDNGNLMVANWTGHGANDSKTGWQVIEFDAEGKVVWHLHDPVGYGSISGIDIIR
jgi:glucose/arabinose dehydrogenase